MTEPVNEMLGLEGWELGVVAQELNPCPFVTMTGRHLDVPIHELDRMVADTEFGNTLRNVHTANQAGGGEHFVAFSYRGNKALQCKPDTMPCLIRWVGRETCWFTHVCPCFYFGKTEDRCWHPAPYLPSPSKPPPLTRIEVAWSMPVAPRGEKFSTRLEPTMAQWAQPTARPAYPSVCCPLTKGDDQTPSLLLHVDGQRLHCSCSQETYLPAPPDWRPQPPTYPLTVNLPHCSVTVGPTTTLNVQALTPIPVTVPLEQTALGRLYGVGRWPRWEVQGPTASVLLQAIFRKEAFFYKGPPAPPDSTIQFCSTLMGDVPTEIKAGKTAKMPSDTLDLTILYQPPHPSTEPLVLVVQPHEIYLPFERQPALLIVIDLRSLESGWPLSKTILEGCLNSMNLGCPFYIMHGTQIDTIPTVKPPQVPLLRDLVRLVDAQRTYPGTPAQWMMAVEVARTIAKGGKQPFWQTFCTAMAAFTRQELSDLTTVAVCMETGETAPEGEFDAFCVAVSGRCRALLT